MSQLINTNINYESDNVNNYLLTVLEPFSHISPIPDLDMTSAILKSVTLTANIPVGVSGAGLLVFTPGSPDGALRLFAWNSVANRYYYLRNIDVDEPLFESFSSARFISGGLKVISSTVSGGNFNVSGTFNACCYQFLPEYNALTFESIASFKRDPQDAVVSQRVADGLVTIARPDGNHEYHPLETNAVVNTRHELVLECLEPELTQPHYMRWTVRNNEIPLANLTGHFWIEVDYEVAATVATVVSSDEVSLHTIHADPANWNATVEVVTNNQVETHEYLAGSGPFYHKMCFHAYLSGFLESVEVELNPALALVVGGAHHLKIFNYSYYHPGYLGPGTMIAFASVTAGQELAIAGKLNYEVVPDSDLARQITTTNARYDTPLEMAMAEHIIANASLHGLKFLYPMHEWDAKVNVNSFLRVCNEKNVIKMSGYGDLFKKILSVASPILGTATSVLTGNPILGGMVDTFGRSLTTRGTYVNPNILQTRGTYVNPSITQRRLRMSSGPNPFTAIKGTATMSLWEVSSRNAAVNLHSSNKGRKLNKDQKKKKDQSLEEGDQLEIVRMHMTYDSEFLDMTVETTIGTGVDIDTEPVIDRSTISTAMSDFWKSAEYGGVLTYRVQQGRYEIPMTYQVAMAIGLDNEERGVEVAVIVTTSPMRKKYKRFTYSYGTHSGELTYSSTVDIAHDVMVQMAIAHSINGMPELYLHIEPRVSVQQLTGSSIGLACAIAYAKIPCAALLTGALTWAGGVVAVSGVYDKYPTASLHKIPLITPYDDRIEDLDTIMATRRISMPKETALLSMCFQNVSPEIIFIGDLGSLTLAAVTATHLSSYGPGYNFPEIDYRREGDNIVPTVKIGKQMSVDTPQGPVYYDTDVILNADWGAMIKMMQRYNMLQGADPAKFQKYAATGRADKLVQIYHSYMGKFGGDVPAKVVSNTKKEYTIDELRKKNWVKILARLKNPQTPEYYMDLGKWVTLANILEQYRAAKRSSGGVKTKAFKPQVTGMSRRPGARANIIKVEKPKKKKTPKVIEVEVKPVSAFGESSEEEEGKLSHTDIEEFFGGSAEEPELATRKPKQYAIEEFVPTQPKEESSKLDAILDMLKGLDQRISKVEESKPKITTGSAARRRT